ncbi:uncharacterized protein LOC122202342 isoform X2 [Panthera leo]|uniref:uncharacterized protein LOC122202342 isoform X2 n=1 Tax=Panthera leo TaxID=9689 RepID=UPI001C6A8857|nr:uncharacterized protein LOC122202342 isoform X2 [Panthera leo]
MERWIKGFWKGRKPRSALRDKETPSREQEMISVRVNSTLMKQLLCARYGGERKVEKTDPAFKGFSHQCWYCNPSLSLLIAAQYSILDSNTCDFHSPNGYQGYPYLSAIIILVHGLLWTYVQFLGNICLKMRRSNHTLGLTGGDTIVIQRDSITFLKNLLKDYFTSRWPAKVTEIQSRKHFFKAPAALLLQTKLNRTFVEHLTSVPEGSPYKLHS